MSGITVRELAKRLNVSPATISMVLNEKPGISEETKQRVLDEIKATGYETPKKQAKNKRDFGSVCFVVHTRGEGIGMDTIYVQDYIKGAEGLFSKAGIVQHVQFARDASAVPSDLYKGLIVLATGSADNQIMPFMGCGVPAVFLDNRFPFLDANTVTMDNTQGIFQAVKHLADIGHKKIAYLYSKPHIHNIEERLGAFRAAMNLFSIPFDTRDIVETMINIPYSFKAVKEYLEVTAERPTAILADNCDAALGAYQACRELNIVIGEELALVGFDDPDYCSVTFPPMTAVRVNAGEMGRIAAERLLSLIAEPGTHQHISVGTEIMVRKSTFAVK